MKKIYDRYVGEKGFYRRLGEWTIGFYLVDFCPTISFFKGLIFNKGTINRINIGIDFRLEKIKYIRLVYRKPLVEDPLMLEGEIIRDIKNQVYQEFRTFSFYVAVKMAFIAVAIPFLMIFQSC